MANVRGTAASEVIDAADGVTDRDDTIFGLDGDDTIFGLYGNDLIKGGAGADRIDGGNGIDTIDYTDSTEGVAVVLSSGIGAGGTAQGDTLINIENANGSAYDDLLVGYSTGSVLHGLNGNDTLQGDDLASDMLYGDNGNDRLKGGGGGDYLFGGAGIDTADYSNSSAGIRVSLWENIVGGTGDYARGGDAEGDRFSGVENVVGSAHIDLIQGDSGDNAIWGLDGADTLYGKDGNDTLYGGSGTDWLYGEVGVDTLYGEDGDDHLIGGPGADLMYGSWGNDIYSVDNSGDVVSEFAGHGTQDRVQTTATYSLAAGSEVEILEAHPFAGSIDLVGNEFDNTIVGSVRSNTIVGGMGRDVMTGGVAGYVDGDIFVWRSTAESGVAGAEADVITDFDAMAGDRIAVNPIDADGDAANGDTAFTFVAGDGAAFTGAAQITYFTTATDTYILFNTDADSAQEMTIRLVGVHTVDASWFVL